jgi:hypothetical protein
VAAAICGATAGGPARTQTAQQTAGQPNLEERARRTCHSIIAVINPPTTTIELTSTLRMGDANAIVISYVARPASGLPRRRNLVCSFQDYAAAAGKTRYLTGVTSDGTALGPARLRFLQRFWVGSRDAETAADALTAGRRR